MKVLATHSLLPPTRGRWRAFSFTASCGELISCETTLSGPFRAPHLIWIVSQGGARRRACHWAGICCPFRAKRPCIVMLIGPSARAFNHQYNFMQIRKTRLWKSLGQRPVNHRRGGGGVGLTDYFGCDSDSTQSILRSVFRGRRWGLGGR